MRRIIAILIISLFVMLPITHAQDTGFEMPAIADGDVIEASFEDDITTQLYAFYGSEGDIVSISMTQDTSNLDPFLVLLNSEGEVLAYDDDSGTTNFAAAIDNVTLEDDGVYFVLASSFFFVDGTELSTDSELPYLFTISGQTTPEDVEDAEVITLDVDTLSIGDSISGESTEEFPLALFYLEANVGDEVTISLEDADFLTVLQVFNPDGDRLAVDASWIQVELEDDGTYVVVATALFLYESLEDGSFEGGTFTLVTE